MYVCLCILFVPKYIRASLVQVSTISVKAALYTISMCMVGLSLEGFPLAHCRGGSFQSMGGWRRGEGQGVREVGRGRGSRFQRPTDLTLNRGRGAQSGTVF